MKKLFLKTLSLLTVVIISLSIVGCNKTPENNNEPQTQGGLKFELFDGNLEIMSHNYNSEVLSNAPNPFLQGSYMVSGYDGTDANVVIPETYEGKPVSAIKEYAFRNNGVIKNVTIPESIKAIGDKAFYQAVNLEKLEIPNSVILLGSCQIYNCLKIESFAFPFVGPHANNPKYFTYLVTDNYVYNVKDSSKASVAAKNMPKSLKRIKLGTGTSIMSYTYYGLTQLESVTLPSSITSIGANAFEACADGFDGPEIIFDGVLTNVEYHAIECKGIKNLKIGANAVLGEGCFLKNFNTETLTIEEGITEIPREAFVGLDSIEGDIIIPKSVKKIDSLAFAGCSSATIKVYFTKNGIHQNGTSVIVASDAFKDCNVKYLGEW